MSVELYPTIEIGKKNYTAYLLLPIKGAMFLDEQLDEVNISLKATRREEPFLPSTLVKITLNTRKKDNRGISEYVEPVITWYMVANDSVAQTIIGRNCYDHTLYLIEATKWLELFVMDSLTFTNNLFNDFDRAEWVIPSVVMAGTEYPQLIRQKQVFLTRYSSDSVVSIPSIEDIVESLPIILVGRTEEEIEENRDYCYVTLSVNDVEYKRYTYNDGIVTEGKEISMANFPRNGQIAIRYYYRYYETSIYASPGWDAGRVFYEGITLNISGKPKRITCKDTINRMLDLAEPLLLGEEPRFKLDEEQAELFDGIFMPEIASTKQTLRESLQQVGQIVHGEPRLTIHENGKPTVSYDLYGGTRKSNIGKLPYLNKTGAVSINNYCTSIDTSAQNLVNRLTWAQGVITEPYTSGYKTVRPTAESVYIRITDQNMEISTAQPIDSIVKLECGIVPESGNDPIIYADITNYVYEATVYNTQLSSYIMSKNYSKAYAVYFTRGSKGIKGLSFRADDDSILFPAFARYAIINILERETGKIVNIPTTYIGAATFYPRLAFRVTYVPYFNARLSHSKSCLNDFTTPIVMPYNQSSNLIETKYFGNNLKGVVARLGNVEKTLTYALTSFSNIPKAGEKFDEDYYISAVSYEIYATYIACTVFLSKDFNRLSAYIGVDSVKRLFEISEKSAMNREVLYKETIMIGEYIPNAINEGKSLVGNLYMRGIEAVFSPTPQNLFLCDKVSCVYCWGGTKQDPSYIDIDSLGLEKVPSMTRVILPVTASAIGNNAVFVWNYKDNYSAGVNVSFRQEGGTLGYYSQDIGYTDYFGKIYYYNFDLHTDSIAPDTLDEQTEIGTALPLPTTYEKSPILGTSKQGTYETTPYLLRKDNREILQFTLQVEFSTNRKNIIIGTALASSLPWVRGVDEIDGVKSLPKPKAYVLQVELNKFEEQLASGNIDLTDEDIATEIDNFYVNEVYPFSNGRFELVIPSMPTDGVAWAIVTPMETITEQVYDEESGEIIAQTYTVGGELLLGANRKIYTGDQERISFYKIHKVLE